ncbi:MAG: Na/Pi cotransporter family protein [Eubacterium sp.]|nr:Na/Pi cotransporter family protein [Eubacterium sp.]
MDFSVLLGLMGGLALFLYGMQMTSTGLEAAAGDRMKNILERLTSNRFMGILVGVGITAIIQSSSATTVMVVGFVNSGLMKITQAVWIIMGANIGTTITGQLIALDVGEIAPLFAMIGVALLVFFKREKLHNYGYIIAGLGFLFLGMELMSEAMEPLRDVPAFREMLTSFSNPLFGVLFGLVFTGIIQSSAASVGILQILTTSGALSFHSAVFVLFGGNIGTCVTAFLASIGTNRNAKRAMLIHLMFNVIGAVMFSIICIVFPLTDWIESWTPTKPAAQIANMHTFFNLVTTALLLPFGSYLAFLSKKILPEVETEVKDVFRLEFLQPSMKHEEHFSIGTSAIIMTGIRNELLRMAQMVKENVMDSFDVIINGNSDMLEMISKKEDYIDFLNKEISRYISNIMIFETNVKDSRLINAYFRICTNLERVADHAMNIGEYSLRLEQNHVKFTPEAYEELKKMKHYSLLGMDTIRDLDRMDADAITKTAAIEQKIDDLTKDYRANHLRRMHKGSCSEDTAVLYTELLIDFERIGDHLLNIAEALGVADKVD